MNVTEARKLFAYDTWANGLVLESVEAVPSGDLRRDLSTSHRSIFGTLVHIVGAEEVWLARWHGEKGALPDPDTIPSLAALNDRWEAVRRGRDAYVDSLNDDALHQEMEIVTLTHGTFRHTPWQMIQHVVNHSSYHRGQIVTLFRQLGLEPPATDLIRFLRLDQ